MADNQSRETFSNFGFLMSAVGSAIGLGNLWKFPYLTGMSGGGIFVLIYLCIVVSIGLICTMGEIIIGRHTKLNPIGAYRKLNAKFEFVGVIGVLVAFLIVTYYNVIGGWITRYLVAYLTGQGSKVAADPQAFFTGFITDPVKPVIWTLIFIAMNQFILAKGISSGLEKANKIMMPLLFVFIIIIAIRSCTLPGAGKGIEFYLKPDFSKLTFDTFSAALGQVFFSLSLGMGIMITYGSYLHDDTSIEKMALTIPIFDTSAALIAGFAILPAVFAFGMEPGQGPGLIFMTLPAVFDSMPGGHIIGVLFFLLVLFAALSSSLSLLEVPASYLIDQFGWQRKKAVATLAVVVFLIGIPESLSNGIFTAQFFGMNFFDFAGYIAESLLMPLAGFMMCIFLGYFWPMEEQVGEVMRGNDHKFALKGYYTVIIKFIAPIAIGFIWLNSSGIIKLFTK